jgi:hypothetical protein
MLTNLLHDIENTNAFLEFLQHHDCGMAGIPHWLDM